MRSNVDHPTVLSEDNDLGAFVTGTCGVIGYIWASGDTGIQEEWTQSIAPIPKEKLEELQHAGSVDEDDGSEEDLNNRPTVPDQDGDSDVSAVEDDDYIKFEKEVEETFQRALDGIDQDNLILEINALRVSTNSDDQIGMCQLTQLAYVDLSQNFWVGDISTRFKQIERSSLVGNCFQNNDTINCSAQQCTVVFHLAYYNH